MATPKKGQSNGKTVRTASTAGTGKNGSSGTNGSDTKPLGSIAGPSASEPVTTGNDGIAAELGSDNGGIGGDKGATRSPEADAPNTPKPGRPGRHAAACTCPKCEARRAAGPSPETVKKGVVLNSAKLAKQLYGAHQMLGMFIPLPDIEAVQGPGGQPMLQPKMKNGAPVMLAHITEEQSVALADALYQVAEEYDLLKYFGGKTPAIAGLIATAGFIYVPKFMTARVLIQQAKAQQRAAAPPNAADMMSAAAEAADAPPPPQGVYKYQ